MRGDERGASAAAAGAGDPGAALPDPQSDLPRLRIVATPILARSGNSGSCSSAGPSAARSTASASSTKKVACGLPILVQTGADNGPSVRSTRSVSGPRPAGSPAIGTHRPHIDRDPAIRHISASSSPATVSIRTRNSPVPRADQPGDAARGVAAGLGLAAVRVADAHRQLRRRIARRLEDDHLIAADPGVPVRQSARSRRLDGECGAAGVEHDKVVAEAVHLQKGHLAHGAAYMAGWVFLSNAPQPMPTLPYLARLGGA